MKRQLKANLIKFLILVAILSSLMYGYRYNKISKHLNYLEEKWKMEFNISTFDVVDYKKMASWHLDEYSLLKIKSDQQSKNLFNRYQVENILEATKINLNRSIDLSDVFFYENYLQSTSKYFKEEREDSLHILLSEEDGYTYLYLIELANTIVIDGKAFWE